MRPAAELAARDELHRRMVRILALVEDTEALFTLAPVLALVPAAATW